MVSAQERRVGQKRTNVQLRAKGYSRAADVQLRRRGDEVPRVQWLQGGGRRSVSSCDRREKGEGLDTYTEVSEDFIEAKRMKGAAKVSRASVVNKTEPVVVEAPKPGKLFL